MEQLKAMVQLFDAVMSLIFVLAGIIIWNIGIWKEDYNRKIYGMVLCVAAYTLWKH